MTVVSYEKRGTVAILTMDNPPVNGLGAALRTGIAERLAEAQADPTVEAIVIAGAGRMFSAGADIREFGGEPPAGTPSLSQVIDTMEGGEKPMVAAIHSVAAGGGLELALGCHHRIADGNTRIGLPEVTLGIIPGAGGTQRLPRLTGAEAALDLITSGRLLPAAKAHAAGIIDAVSEGAVLDAAVAAAEKLVADGAPPRRAGTVEDRIAPARGNAQLFTDFRKGMAKAARGLHAPYVAVDLIEAAANLPLAEGLAKERAAFLELVAATESKALRHAFFAEREVAKIPDVPKDTSVKKIETVGVIGCGTMGGGIAMNFANAGIPVRVLESEPEALQRGLEIVGLNYARTVSRGRLSQAEMDKRMALIEGIDDYGGLAEVDMVVEAVFEEMDVKKEVFAALDRACKPGAILATNTSTLDVDEIASATARPESVIGTHFFSPANVMRLMENVRGAKSSKETIATTMAISKTIGKVGVLVGVCDGFVGNRMLHQYMREANFLIEEGALPHQVDKVLFDFGMPMGAFAMGDLAGLDVSWRIRKGKAANRPNHLRYSPLADRVCEMGRFGQKTKAGWYLYEEGSRAPIPDPEIEKLIIEASKELGIERREIGEQEILERCFYPLVNEGAKILEEGLALRASDIDTIWIHGYGFPRYRGGPMFWADTVGLGRIHEAMQRFHAEQGEVMTPAPLLARLAAEGKGFADL
jgi:3-hydroxyacyl-CoA dehydrogenase